MAGMRESIKSEAMVLCRTKIDCSLQAGNDSLPQVESKCVGALLTSEDKMERKLDRQMMPHQQ